MTGRKNGFMLLARGYILVLICTLLINYRHYCCTGTNRDVSYVLSKTYYGYNRCRHEIYQVTVNPSLLIYYLRLVSGN